MPSRLVADVRRLIADRTEAGAPLTALERTFLLAAIAPRTNTGSDVVDELEEAIAYGRRVLLTEPHPSADPAVVAQRRREAACRLLRAARAAIDFDPAPEVETATAALAGAPTEPARPYRADLDG